MSEKVISLLSEEQVARLTDKQKSTLLKKWVSDSGCLVETCDETRTYTQGSVEDDTVFLLLLEELSNKRGREGSYFMGDGQRLNRAYKLFRITCDGKQECLCEWRQAYPLLDYHLTLDRAKQMYLQNPVVPVYRICKFGFVE